MVEGPVFDEQPQTQIVELGDNAIFSCSLQLANVQVNTEDILQSN